MDPSGESDGGGLRMKKMARIDTGQPPWSWLLGRAVCAGLPWRLLSPAPLAAVEGKALFQDRVDTTLTIERH